MACRRSYRRPYRRYRRSRRGYRRPAPTFSGMAFKYLKGTALALLKSKLGLNTEKHWLDTVETGVALTTTATDMAYALNIPQDDTVNGRSGASIRLTSYTCTITLNSGTASNNTRILFVKWKNTRGTTPSGSAVLDSATRITSPYNMGDAVSSIGYKVLFDRTYQLAATGQDGDRKVVHFKYTPLSHHITWTAGTAGGTAAAMSDGYIMGYIFTDNVATSASYSANHRVKFVDN